MMSKDIEERAMAKIEIDEIKERGRNLSKDEEIYDCIKEINDLYDYKIDDSRALWEYKESAVKELQARRKLIKESKLGS